ncbi:MAG: glycosyltransferase family 87 protein [Candidatus Methanomethylophilus sp.]|nr:glycosyltransferase family 87 protein [Methanomethylophilus sp.]
MNWPQPSWVAADWGRIGGRPLFLIIGAILIMILAVAHICSFTIGGDTGEVQRNYLPYVLAILQGIPPYTDTAGLSWEYPPLGFIIMLVPGLFSTSGWGYQIGFSLFAATFAVLGLWIVCQLAKFYGRNENMAALGYTILMALMIQFLFERYDIFPAVMVAGAVLLYVKDHKNWAFLLLAVGTMTKVYPAIFFLLFLLPLLVRHDWRRSATGAGVFIGGCLLLWLPFIALSPDNFTMFLTYHSDRGIQLESTLASLILAAENMGLTTTWTINSFGSFNLTGGLADALKGIAIPIMIAFILVTYAVFAVVLWKRGADEKQTAAILPLGMATVMLAFIVFNKVFSAQYIIWLIPVILVALLTVPLRNRSWLLTLMLLLCIDFLTFRFRWIYYGLCIHDSWCDLLLLCRNLLMIGLLMLIAYQLCRAGDHTSEDPEEEKHSAATESDKC